jgi:anti-sigma factor RsiW
MHKFLARIRFRRDHQWAPDRMSEYLDGELRPQPRTRIERHLAECAECRRLIAGLTRLVDALHRLPAPEPARDPVRLAAAVRVRLEEPPAS